MSSVPQAHTDEVGGSSRKRQRIAQACEECRDRKRKCDGVRPVCGACSRRAARTCTWNEQRNTKGWSNSYVEGLQSRIKKLEVALETASTGSNIVQSMPEVNGLTLGCIAEGQTDSTSEDDDEALDITSSDAGVNAMGVFQSISRGTASCPCRASGYYGASSTVTLLKETFRAIGNETNPIQYSQSSDYFFGASDFRGDSQSSMLQGDTRSSSDRNSNAAFSARRFNIPTRVEADSLLESFWKWVHSLYPYVHRPSFEARYRSIWIPTLDRLQDSQGDSQTANEYYNSISDILFYCMLNLIFAMGALSKPTLSYKERDSISRVFFNRAKILINIDELAHGSTALVQALLLMGQYLQSTDEASGCWNIVGLAIRVCQGIGLHNEPRCCWGESCTIGLHSQLDREVRRRTWTCSIILDRFVALTYGRPLMIHPEVTSDRLCLPLAIDDEYLTGSGQSPGKQPEGTVSLVSAYVEAVRLQDITSRFITRANKICLREHQDSYMELDGSTRCNQIIDLDVHMVIDFEKSFEEWRQRLPPHLRFCTYESSWTTMPEQNERRFTLLKRQANTLSLKSLHARLTVLRPALSILCKTERERGNVTSETYIDSSSMTQEMIAKSANLCLRAARSILDIITSSVDHHDECLPAPWYNVFYIHSCAIVFLLGYLCTPSYITCMNKSSLADAYNRCIEFFQGCSSHYRSARRCNRILMALQKQVFGWKGCNNEVNNAGNDPVSDAASEEAAIPQPAIPLFDPSQPQDATLSDLPRIETTMDQTTFDWVGDMTDMTWLSFAPFWDDEANDMTYW